MKAWWKHNSSDLITDLNSKPRPKSFWLETLVVNLYDNIDDNWASRFIRLLGAIEDNFNTIGKQPVLVDPGMPEQLLSTSMTDSEYKIFINKISKCLTIANEAYSEPDRSRSSELWSSIFGNDFPIEKSSEKNQYLSARTYAIGDVSHMRALRYPVISKDNITITAELYRKSFDNKQVKIRLGNLPSNSSVRNDLFIRFKATPAFKPGPYYDVYWRVVNTGAHASSDKGLRGGPFLDHTGLQLVRWEPTKYTGKHWIECFIVGNNKVIGTSDKFYVNITNPSFPSA